ncbi:MAG: DUF445 domain-containing protein [Alphaproteobacteria bacterium]|nr:DUF445 domain-containing protein [Alphaproteobacteria bacterium]
MTEPASLARNAAPSEPQPPSPEQREAAQRASLARHRAIATGLLVLMAGIVIGTYYWPEQDYWTQLVQAAAKAGFVGGLADWFAVTALFRHPLGLPIPHTAIIPRQKDRIGQGLGRFVSRYVVTETEMRRLLGRVDAAAALADWLRTPGNGRLAARHILAALPAFLAAVEDGRARRVLRRLVPRVAGREGPAPLVARGLRLLIAGGHHQAALSYALGAIKEALRENEATLKQGVAERLPWYIPRWFDSKVAGQILGLLNGELEKLGQHDSEIRRGFDRWAERMIAEIENSPDRRAQIAAAARRVLASQPVQDWLMSLWHGLREAVAAEAADPKGRMADRLGEALANLGRLLAEDEAMRGRLNGVVSEVAAALLPRGQEGLSRFMASVVEGWDARTVANRIELAVGKDLQYVRINGTLVGALAGGAVFALLHWWFGHVSF